MADDLVLKISADVDKAVSGISSVSGEVEGLKDSLADLSTQAKKTSENTKEIKEATTDWGAGLVKLQAGLEIAMTAFNALSGIMGQAFAGFREGQEASEKLSNTLALIGTENVAAATESFKAFADEMERNTIIQDDVTLNLISQAKAIGLSDQATKDLVQSSADLAAVTGDDVNTAFSALLGTFKGQARAVATYAPELANLTEEQLKNGEAVKYLGMKYEGFAKAQSQTAQGQLTQLSNLYQKTLEDIGGMFTTLFRLDDVSGGIAILNGFRSVLESMMPVVQSIRDGMDEFFTRLSNGFAEMQHSAEVFEAVLIAVGAAMLVAFGPAIYGAIVGIATAIAGAVAAAAPLILTIAGVTAAVLGTAAAIEFVVNNFSSLGDIAKAVLTSLLDGFIAVGKGIAEAFNFKKILSGESMSFDQFKADVGKAFSEPFKQIKVDTGVAGKAIEGMAGFMKGFSKEVVTATKNEKVLGKETERNRKKVEETKKQMEAANKAQKDHADATKEAAKAYEQMRKDAQTALDNIIKKVIELQNRNRELRGNQIEIIEEKARGELKTIDILENQLVVNNGLTAQAKEQLAIARELVAENEKLEKTKLQKEVLNDLLEKNKELLRMYHSIGATQRQNIEMNRLASIEAINRKHDELRAQGHINNENSIYIDQLKAQQNLVNAIAARNKERAPSNRTERLTDVGKVIGQQIQNGSNMLMGAAGLISGVVSGVTAVMDAAKSLIDVVPNLLESATELVDAIANFPQRLADTFQGLLRSVTNLISNFPDLLERGLNQIVASIAEFMDQLPRALIRFLDELPKNLIHFLDKLPEIAEAVVTAFISAIPDIVMAFLRFLNEGMPRLALKMVEVMAIRLPNAIVKGIIEGLNGAFKNLSRIFKGDIINTKDITKKLLDIRKSIVGSTERLFSVKDLMPAKSADELKSECLKSDIVNAGKSALEMVRSALRDLGEKWNEIKSTYWDPFIEHLDNVYSNIKEKYWDPVTDYFTEKFTAIHLGIKEKVWDPIFKFFENLGSQIGGALQGILNGVTEIFGLISEEILKPFIQAFSTAMTKIYEKVIAPLIQGVQKFGEHVKEMFSNKILAPAKELIGHWTELAKKIFTIENLKKGLEEIDKKVLQPIATFFKDVGKGFSEIGKTLSGAGKTLIENVQKGLGKVATELGDVGTKIWDGLKAGIKGIGSVIQDALSGSTNFLAKIFSIPPEQVEVGRGGTIENKLGFNLPFVNFAKGKIPGHAVVPGDSVMNDKHLAMVSSGEAIIPRSLMENPVIAKLVDVIMGGKLPGYAWGKLPKVGGVGGAILQGDIGGAIDQITNVTPGQIFEEFENLTEMIASIGPDTLWGFVKDAIWKIFEANKFAKGGMVGDNVPAMLDRREFVMSPRGVATAGVPMLSALNAGRATIAPVTNNFEMRITIDNKGQPIDESFIRQKMMPTIEKELRRATQSGRFVVDARGVRTGA